MAAGRSEAAAVTIVGAGPSGLAVAGSLRHLSIPYTILEREDYFASIWQKYSYDRLHLHLPKHVCQLPFSPFPDTCSTYPSREEFVTYLRDYVSRFDIGPMYRRSVDTAAYDEADGKWKVRARNLVSDEVEEYESRFLVVATGLTCDAKIPDVEGLEGFVGEVLHSTEYKNGKKFEGKRVLLVGSGNSGMEIALDLADCGAETSIVVRSPVHVLSREIVHAATYLLNYLPLKWVDDVVTVMGKTLYGDLSKYGIQRPSKEGPLTMKIKYGKYPIIDVGTIHKIKSGEIQVLPGIRSIRSNTVLFENDEECSFDAIVFATGFKRPTRQWLKGDHDLLNDDGLPRHSIPDHWKGRNGLYCVGLAHKGFLGSALDAQNIAQDIKALL